MYVDIVISNIFYLNKHFFFFLVQGQDASGPWDGCIRTRWLQHFANPNLRVVVAKCWFLGFVVWDRTFLCSIFSATLTYLTGFMAVYRAARGCPGLFPDCGWYEWPSPGEVGFYDHAPSWYCCLWIHNCVWLRSVGCRPTHHVVEHLTYRWLMVLTLYGLLL